jgi:hypothetical protein
MDVSIHLAVSMYVVGHIFLGNKTVREKIEKQVHSINRNEKEQEHRSSVFLVPTPKFLLFRNSIS